MSKNDADIVKLNLRNFIDGQLLPAETRKMFEEDENDWKAGKKEFRNWALNKRANFRKGSHKDFPEFEAEWKKFYQKIVPDYIAKITKKINPEIPANFLIELWEKRQDDCKWLENFIKLHDFHQNYLIASQAEPKWDKNAADDIEHLIYLLHVDGIVSNEKHGFMSKAKQFFPTKDFLSVDEFVEKIEVVGKKGATTPILV